MLKHSQVQINVKTLKGLQVTTIRNRQTKVLCLINQKQKTFMSDIL